MSEKKYKVSITGKLNIFENRDAMSVALKAQGHTFVDSVSSKTEILVNNDNTSDSIKNKTAKSYNIPILTEEEAIAFLKLKQPK